MTIFPWEPLIVNRVHLLMVPLQTAVDSAGTWVRAQHATQRGYPSIYKHQGAIPGNVCSCDVRVCRAAPTAPAHCVAASRRCLELTKLQMVRGIVNDKPIHISIHLPSYQSISCSLIFNYYELHYISLGTFDCLSCRSANGATANRGR